MLLVLSQFVIAKPSRARGHFLLYSTHSGNMIRCSVDEYQVINDDISQLNSDTLSSLSDLGLVVDADVDEISQLLEPFNYSKAPSPTLALTIVPTTRCNFACTYCFEGCLSVKTMSDSTIDHLSNLINRRAPDLENLHITWFGGEPLLATDIVYKIADRAALAAL